MKKSFKKIADMGSNNSHAAVIGVYDRNFKVLYQNTHSRDIMGDHVSNYCFQSFGGGKEVCNTCSLTKSFLNSREYRREITKRINGTIFRLEIISSPIHDASGNIIAGLEIIDRMSAGMMKEKDSGEDQESLRKQIHKKTEQLQLEMEGRIKLLVDLKKAKEDIEMLTRSLAENSIALKVLLHESNQDRDDLKMSIEANVGKLIIPYIDHLKRSSSKKEERTHLKILESMLLGITSSFSNKLSTLYNDLTPKEILIAGLINNGLQDKEISSMLNISLETVKTHRQNIRRKLGIQGKRFRLKNKLLSISE